MQPAAAAVNQRALPAQPQISALIPRVKKIGHALPGKFFNEHLRNHRVSFDGKFVRDYNRSIVARADVQGVWDAHYEEQFRHKYPNSKLVYVAGPKDVYVMQNFVDALHFDKATANAEADKHKGSGAKGKGKKDVSLNADEGAAPVVAGGDGAQPLLNEEHEAQRGWYVINNDVLRRYDPKSPITFGDYVTSAGHLLVEGAMKPLGWSTFFAMLTQGRFVKLQYVLPLTAGLAFGAMFFERNFVVTTQKAIPLPRKDRNMPDSKNGDSVVHIKGFESELVELGYAEKADADAEDPNGVKYTDTWWDWWDKLWMNFLFINNTIINLGDAAAVCLTLLCPLGNCASWMKLIAGVFAIITGLMQAYQDNLTVGVNGSEWRAAIIALFGRLVQPITKIMSWMGLDVKAIPVFLADVVPMMFAFLHTAAIWQTDLVHTHLVALLKLAFGASVGPYVGIVLSVITALIVAQGAAAGTIEMDMRKLWEAVGIDQNIHEYPKTSKIDEWLSKKFGFECHIMEKIAKLLYGEYWEDMLMKMGKNKAAGASAGAYGLGLFFLCFKAISTAVEEVIGPLTGHPKLMESIITVGVVIAVAISGALGQGIQKLHQFIKRWFEVHGQQAAAAGDEKESEGFVHDLLQHLTSLCACGCCDSDIDYTNNAPVVAADAAPAPQAMQYQAPDPHVAPGPAQPVPPPPVVLAPVAEVPGDGVRRPPQAAGDGQPQHAEAAAAVPIHAEHTTPAKTKPPIAMPSFSAFSECWATMWNCNCCVPDTNVPHPVWSDQTVRALQAGVAM